MKLTEKLLNEIKTSNEIYSGSEGVVTIYKKLALKEYRWGMEQKYLNLYKQHVNKLRYEKAVNTPVIYDTNTLLIDGETVPYLLMERAKGNPVFVASYAYLSEAIPKLTGEDKSMVNYVIYPVLRKKYSKFISEKISDGSQMLFDRFIDNLIEVNKSRYLSVDNFGENIYFDDRSGFSLIDFSFSEAKAKEEQNSIEKKTLQVGFDYLNELYYDINLDSVEPKYVRYLNEAVDKTVKACEKANIPKESIKHSFATNCYPFKI